MHEPTPEMDALLRRVRAFVREELAPLEGALPDGAVPRACSPRWRRSARA
jgi:hypothetical protein